MTNSKKRRVFIVDDHPLLRQGLAEILKRQDDLELCGEAADAPSASKSIESSRADIAVVDISLEGKSGLELIRHLQIIRPGLPVLVMSMHDESIYAERALRAGARGYVMKKAGAEAVLQAIRRVLSGKKYVSENLASMFIERLRGRANGKSQIETLTDREFEVFHLIGEGCSTREVGKRLCLSPKTIDVYRQRIKGKLGQRNYADLVQHAIRWVESEQTA